PAQLFEDDGIAGEQFAQRARGLARFGLSNRSRNSFSHKQCLTPNVHRPGFNQAGSHQVTIPLVARINTSSKSWTASEKRKTGRPCCTKSLSKALTAASSPAKSTSKIGWAG